MLKTFRIIPIMMISLLLYPYPSNVNSYVSKVKTTIKLIDKALDGYRVSKTQIKQLVKLDYKDLMKVLSKYHDEPKKFNAILLAIARERKVISAAEADEVFKNLGKVKNFRNVAKLLCSKNPAQIKGALYELKVANSAKKNGFHVVEFRQKYLGDPAKQFTDIDIILKSKNGKTIAIECKSYGGVIADTVHADAKTLGHFADQNPNTVKVFMFAEEPSKLTRKILTEGYGCIVLAGDSDAQLLALSYMI